MNCWRRKGMMGLLVGWLLGLTGTVYAGPYVNLMQPCDCPPNHYSALHVMVPAFYRWAAWCQGPCRYTFARVLHPDIATTTYIKRYRCPSVAPLSFELQNYPGLSGTPPTSSYQSQAETAQARPRLLQELLSPREEKAPGPERLPPPREEQIR
jgi:hypothetical protein